MSLLLTLLITFSTVLSVKADNMTDNQKKLNELNDSIDKNKKQLEKINKDKDNVYKDVKTLDVEINAVSQKLSSMNSKISDLNKNINSANEQIKSNEKKLEEQTEVFKQRIRSMYTNGNTAYTYMDVIINSDDFSDLINRIEWVRRIVDRDKDIIESIKDIKSSIEIKKTQFEKNKKEVLVLKQQIDIQLKDLNKKSEDKKSLMASLEKDKSTYEKMINEEEKQSSNIQNMIKSMGKPDKPSASNSGSANSSSGEGSTSVSNGNYASVTGGAYPITSSYGYRKHPVLGTQKFHSGLDIGVPSGTSIYALTNGTVVYSGEMSGYGNVVMVNHGNIISLYAHNSSLAVSEGQTVNKGQLIAYSGNTGLSSGPHLHFEIRQASSGSTIDPSPYYIR